MLPHSLTPCETLRSLLLLHPFSSLFSINQFQKGKSSLDLNQARDDRVLGCSGISWTTYKQSTPRSRQITTPTPHHSISTGQTLFWRPANSVRKQAINDELQGSAAAYLRCGGVVNNQIKTSLLLSLSGKNFKMGEYWQSYKQVLLIT